MLSPQPDAKKNAVAQLLESIENKNRNVNNNNNNSNNSAIHNLTPIPQPIDHEQLHTHAQQKALDRQRQAQSTYGKYNSNFNGGYYGYLTTSGMGADPTATGGVVPHHNNQNDENLSQQPIRNSSIKEKNNTKTVHHHHHRQLTSNSDTSSCSEVTVGSSRWSDIDSLPDEDRYDVYELHQQNRRNKNNKENDELHLYHHRRNKKSENEKEGEEVDEENEKPKKDDDLTSREYTFTASRRKPESPQLSQPRKRSARPEDSSLTESFQALAAHKRRQAEAELRSLRYDELLRQPVSPKPATTTPIVDNALSSTSRVPNRSSTVETNLQQQQQLHRQKPTSQIPQALMKSEPLQRRVAMRRQDDDNEGEHRRLSSPVRRLQQLENLKQEEDRLVQKQQSKKHIDPSLLQFIQRQHQHHQLLQNSNTQEDENVARFRNSTTTKNTSNINNNENNNHSHYSHHYPAPSSSILSSPPSKRVKMIFNDKDGSFTQVALPQAAHETQDHRTMLTDKSPQGVASVARDRMPATSSSNIGDINTTGNNQDSYSIMDQNKQQLEQFHQQVARHTAQSSRSESTNSSKFDYSKNTSFVEVKESQLLASEQNNNNQHLHQRPEQHRFGTGMNDSVAFAEKSRLTMKQETYNNPDRFQQNSLNSKELAVGLMGQVEKHQNQNNNDVTNDFAPDLALAQRDFATRAQIVRKKVTETRILMALKAVQDTEDRERLVMRITEAIERGTHKLLVNHLGNRMKMMEQEKEERDKILQIKNTDLLMVGKRVRFRKEEAEMRKRISDEEEERFLRLRKNLRTVLDSHQKLVDLVLNDEPRRRQFLVSESIDALNFLMLKSVEMMEEKHRVFLISGMWCSSEESVREIQEQFDDFFESASQRRVRRAMRAENKKDSRLRGWMGPLMPSRGQYFSESKDNSSSSYYHNEDAIVSAEEDIDIPNNNNNNSSFFTRIALNNAAKTVHQKKQSAYSNTASSVSNSLLQQEKSDAEVIFAELNRASRRLASEYYSSNGRNSNRNRPNAQSYPMSPSVSASSASKQNHNSNNNSNRQSSSKPIAAFDSKLIDQNNSLHPLWSSAENAKKAQLSAQIAALRRGEDLTVTAFATRHYRGPQGFYQDATSNNNNSLQPETYEAPSSSDPEPLYYQNQINQYDNFGRPSQHHHHQQGRHKYSSADDEIDHDYDYFNLTTLEGLHTCTSAILNWQGWLPVSVYYSVIVPFARLMRDESVSRLALEEGEQVRLQSLIATKALDIGQRMTRALNSYDGAAAMKLAHSKIAQVPVRLFAMAGQSHTSTQNGRNSPPSNQNQNQNQDDTNNSNNSNNNNASSAASIALQHDLRLFRLADPDRQGFVSYPSVIAVLRSSPDLVGVGRDVFRSVSNEELAVLFQQSSSENSTATATSMSRMNDSSSSTCVLTFPEFRDFMQTLRQMMVYHETNRK